MIRLQVEEYCHSCPSFEPEVSVDTVHLESGYAITTIVESQVTCKYRRRCAAMFRYLQKEVTKEDVKDEQN